MLRKKLALILAMAMVASAMPQSVIASEKNGGVYAESVISGSALEARINEVGENISKSYEKSTADWQVMDNVAFGIADNGFTEAEKNDYVVTSTAIAVASSSITDWERIAIALSATEVDATSLQDTEGNTVNLIEKIAKGNASSLNAAVFGLIAYDSGEYTVESGNTREVLINTILSAQLSDNGWTFWGSVADPDMTGMAISALAPYYLSKDFESANLSEDTYNNVKAAMDKAIIKLGEMQSNTGAWASYGSDNSNSTAMAITAMIAVGIDPYTDSRFIKGENTALDGIMSFALADNSGFGYTNNKTLNAYGTEQAFRALAAYKNYRAGERAYNVYSRGFFDEYITVMLGVIGDDVHGVFGHTEYAYWLKDCSLSVKEGSSVVEVLIEAESLGYTFAGAATGYVYSITNAEGTTLASGDNGMYSGWMYAVNGTDPYVGISECILSEGDSIELYYVDDYRPMYGMLVYGDADGDGAVTANDAAVILQYVLSPSGTEKDEWKKDIDTDGDEIITSTDAANVLQKSLNSSFEFAVEK